MFHRRRPVTLVNGRVAALDGEASSIRFADRVIALDEAPEAGDAVVDLDGAYVLPGLVNAHEHLELNHYGRLKCRDRYDNATDWIDDLRPVVRSDSGIRAKSACSLRDRLFIGGLKNLLAGATTVAHHNPIYSELNGRFPVRVVRAFGWAHSFALQGHPVGARGEIGHDVAAACRATPQDQPFVMHAAEGVDAAAAEEVSRLEELGCLRRGTVLVHGTALTLGTWRRILAAGADLVWCPQSNLFLFGRTIPARSFLDAAPDAWSRLALGTDSRVTGSDDVLDELRAAMSAGPITATEALRMVTVAAARVLRLTGSGEIACGGPADLLIVPATRDTAADALVSARRAGIGCVVIGGRPMVGAPRYEEMFAARRVAVRPVEVDGAERLIDAAVAQDLARCSIHEPGVTSVS